MAGDTLRWLRVRRGASTPDSIMLASENWTRVTYQNSWVDFGGTSAPVAYYKDPLGWVHLRGSAKDGTRVNGTTVIFNLPQGYRPGVGVMWFPVMNSAIVGGISVRNNGNVVVENPSANTTRLSFDNVQFMAEA